MKCIIKCATLQPPTFNLKHTFSRHTHTQSNYNPFFLRQHVKHFSLFISKFVNSYFFLPLLGLCENIKCAREIVKLVSATRYFVE